MNRLDVLRKLETIFREIFDAESLVVTEESTPEDIENWDSMGQVYLIAEIEDEFKIELGEEMTEIESVKDIIDIILNKLNN